VRRPGVRLRTVCLRVARTTRTKGVTCTHIVGVITARAAVDNPEGFNWFDELTCAQSEAA
jgi:hypothetical protein